MPRPIWTGALGFGLVSVPVRMFSATEDRDVHFHQLQAGTGRRIRNKRVAEGTGREVDYDDIVKGYEVSDGSWVELTDEELDAIAPGRSRTIEIEQFVELEEIDPIYFDATYYLAPGEDEGASRAYRLLVDTMDEKQRVAITRFVMRGKQHLAAVRPKDGALLLETMLFPDEVRSRKGIPGLPVRAKAKEQERRVAAQLVDSLTREWKPTEYEDTYRKRVQKLIRDKAKGKEIVEPEEPEPSADVKDLMEALEASLQQDAKATRRSSPSRAPRSRRTRRAATKRKRRPARKAS